MSRQFINQARKIIRQVQIKKINPPSIYCCGECAISSCSWGDYAKMISYRTKINELKKMLNKLENKPKEPFISSNDDRNPHCKQVGFYQWINYFEKKKEYIQTEEKLKSALKLISH